MIQIWIASPASLVYYFEVGDVGLGVLVENAVHVNCTGDMIIVFFYSIFQTSTRFSYVKKVAMYLARTLFRQCLVQL